MAIRRSGSRRRIRRVHRNAFRSLRPSRRDPITDILTREGHVVRIANFELPVDTAVICRSVIFASDSIVGMLAEFGSFFVGWVAHLEAEHFRSDEVDPFNYLTEGVGRR